MTKAEQRKRAVKLTLPVFCGYIVLGIAFGATLAQAGYQMALREDHGIPTDPKAADVLLVVISNE